MREEFLELLRTDQAFRDEVRRYVLTEELLALPVEFGRLMVVVGEAVTLLRRLADAQVRLEERVGRLEEAMARLAEAQARTEERVGRLEEVVAQLVEAQARMEERVGRLEEAVAQLAEAQARTEERVGRLEEGVAQLVEAQARMEERVGRLEEVVAQLAEAQARTEARVEELAKAQISMQEAVRALAQQVGRLSEAVGFTLEDLAREVTPAYLAQHYGIQVGELERRFFTLDGEEVEVDLYGEGWREGEPVVVIGEVRSRIHGRDVEAAVRRAQELKAQLIGAPIVVLFGFVIHPLAKEVAKRLGAIVISSSGRL